MVVVMMTTTITKVMNMMKVMKMMEMMKMMKKKDVDADVDVGVDVDVDAEGIQIPFSVKTKRGMLLLLLLLLLVVVVVVAVVVVVVVVHPSVKFFCVAEVDGDGDCLFHALAHFDGYDGRALRQRSSDYRWGGHTAMAAYSLMKGRRIVVHMQQAGAVKVEELSHESVHGQGEVQVALYNGGDHYDALLPSSKQPLPPAYFSFDVGGANQAFPSLGTGQPPQWKRRIAFNTPRSHKKQPPAKEAAEHGGLSATPQTQEAQQAEEEKEHVSAALLHGMRSLSSRWNWVDLQSQCVDLLLKLLILFAGLVLLPANLGRSRLSAVHRAERAWLAGQWAKAVLQGRGSSPNRTETIELGNRFWVVLRSTNCTAPRVFTTSAAFFAAVGSLAGSNSVTHAFPSETEARIYIEAAGFEFPGFN
eukprot:s2443_g7.t2